MKCQRCGIIIEDKWLFCPKCSNNLRPESQITQIQTQPQPAQINPIPQQVQQSNYTTITSDKQQEVARNLAVAGLILIILGFSLHIPLLAILGGGLPRFYVGKLLSGALYSITGGFFGIGLVFDLIKISTGQFADNVGQPLRR